MQIKKIVFQSYSISALIAGIGMGIILSNQLGLSKFNSNLIGLIITLASFMSLIYIQIKFKINKKL